MVSTYTWFFGLWYREQMLVNDNGYPISWSQTPSSKNMTGFDVEWLFHLMFESSPRVFWRKIQFITKIRCVLTLLMVNFWGYIIFRNPNLYSGKVRERQFAQIMFVYAARKNIEGGYISPPLPGIGLSCYKYSSFTYC